MVDCRSLIEFCRAFEQHRNMANNTNPNTTSDHPNNHRNSNSRPKKHHSHSFNPFPSYSFCDLSLFAAIDILLLLMVLGSIGVLTVPYFKFLFHHLIQLLPLLYVLIGDVIYNAPFAYALGVVLSLFIVIVIWEFINIQARKCGNPYCKGLRKAVEFDIQLESEECVKCLSPTPEDVYGLQPLDIGEDHKELEAELKRMAPINGRTVLIFRTPCGCPIGRMEVWGPKKSRRIKK